MIHHLTPDRVEITGGQIFFLYLFFFFFFCLMLQRWLPPPFGQGRNLITPTPHLRLLTMHFIFPCKLWIIKYILLHFFNMFIFDLFFFIFYKEVSDYVNFVFGLPAARLAPWLQLNIICVCLIRIRIRNTLLIPWGKLLK